MNFRIQIPSNMPGSVCLQVLIHMSRPLEMMINLFTRGVARIENIHRYESDFAPVTTIRLEQNYRSTDVILKAANAVISNNTGRLGKELWTDQGAGSPIQLYAAFNEQTRRGSWRTESASMSSKAV